MLAVSSGLRTSWASTSEQPGLAAPLHRGLDDQPGREFEPGPAWVAAAYSVVASAASGHGNTTYPVSLAWARSRASAPATA